MLQGGRSGTPKGSTALGILVAVALLGAIAAIVWLIVSNPFQPDTLVVLRNKAPHRLTLVQAALTYAEGGTTIERSGDLEPDQEHAFGPSALEFSVRLTFVMDGRERFHSVPEVTLWEGDTYVLEIQPDGSVEPFHLYGENGEG